jgi:hypothetical protein
MVMARGNQGRPIFADDGERKRTSALRTRKEKQGLNERTRIHDSGLDPFVDFLLTRRAAEKEDKEWKQFSVM